MRQKPTVPCRYCGGSGRIELTGRYRETLELIGVNEEVTGASLARRDGCQATAMNNRLAALERFGLLVSKLFGRERRYRRV